jgi:enoyl-CoA hydratase/carnithine racemase
MLLTSSVVKADEAFRLNLVNRLAPGAATENTALELAGRIAAFDTEAVANLKRMLHKWDDIEGRSADEGRGQVEWQRHGPGLG